MNKFYSLKRSLLAILAFGEPKDFARLLEDKQYFDYISNPTHRDSYYCLTIDDIDYLLAHTSNEANCLTMLNHIICISRGKMLVYNSDSNATLPHGIPKIPARVALFLTKLDCIAVNYIFDKTFIQFLIANVTSNSTWTVEDFLALNNTKVIYNSVKDLFTYFTKSTIWEMARDLSPTNFNQLIACINSASTSKRLNILYKAYHNLGDCKLVSDNEFIDYIILGELCSDDGFLTDYPEDLTKIVKYFCPVIETCNKSKAHILYNVLQYKYPGLLNMYSFNRHMTEDSYLTIVREFLKLSDNKDSLISSIQCFCVD